MLKIVRSWFETLMVKILGGFDYFWVHVHHKITRPVKFKELGVFQAANCINLVELRGLDF